MLCVHSNYDFYDITIRRHMNIYIQFFYISLAYNNMKIIYADYTQ